jgi:hypothetical protein
MSDLQTQDKGRIMSDGTDKELGTHDVYFDDKLEKAIATDENGDYLLKASTGRFIKLSGEKSLEEAIKEHNELNKPLAERLAEQEKVRLESLKEEPLLTEEGKKKLEAEEKTEE